MSNTPHRFREEQFRRYEKLLRAVRDNYPAETKFRPSNFSAETASCRFRDAVKALRNNPSWVDRPLIDWVVEFWSTLEVAHDGTVVTVRKKTARGAKEVEFDLPRAQQSAARIVLDAPHFDEIGACCLLIVRNRITEPVLITNLDMNIKLHVDLLLKNTYPDLLLTPQADGSLLLI